MMRTIGWKLDPEQRARLLEQFPPHWPQVIADHVTLRADSGPDEDLPPPANAQIVGTADDGEELEAMVVALDGSTARPDGSTYHITWSLDRAKGRRPVESNDLIGKRGWKALPQPIPIKITPARWG